MKYSDKLQLLRESTNGVHFYTIYVPLFIEDLFLVTQRSLATFSIIDILNKNCLAKQIAEVLKAFANSDTCLSGRVVLI